jgi:hypothetical protein
MISLNRSPTWNGKIHQHTQRRVTLSDPDVFFESEEQANGMLDRQKYSTTDLPLTKYVDLTHYTYTEVRP